MIEQREREREREKRIYENGEEKEFIIKQQKLEKAMMLNLDRIYISQFVFFWQISSIVSSIA